MTAYTIDTPGELASFFALFASRSTPVADLSNALNMLIAQMRSAICSPLIEYFNAKSPTASTFEDDTLVSPFREFWRLWECPAFSSDPAIQASVLELTVLCAQHLQPPSDKTKNVLLHPLAYFACTSGLCFKLLYRIFNSRNVSGEYSTVWALRLLRVIVGVSKAATDCAWKHLDPTTAFPRSLAKNNKKLSGISDLIPSNNDIMLTDSSNGVTSIRWEYLQLLAGMMRQGGAETKSSIAELRAISCDDLLVNALTDPAPQLLFLIETLKETILNHRYSASLWLGRGKQHATSHGSPVDLLLTLLRRHDRVEVVEAIDALLSHLYCRVLPSSKIKQANEEELEFDKKEDHPSISNYRLILDFLNALHPLESVREQRLAIKVLQEGCSLDLLCAHLKHLHRSLSFGLPASTTTGSSNQSPEKTKWIATLSYLVQAAQVISNLKIVVNNTNTILDVIQYMCPSSRVIWTRLMAEQSDATAVFLSLTLLESVLAAVYALAAHLESIESLRKRDDLLKRAVSILPDFQTVLAACQKASDKMPYFKILRWYYVLFKPSFDPTKLLLEEAVKGNEAFEEELLALVAIVPIMVDPFSTINELQVSWFTKAVKGNYQEVVREMLWRTGFVEHELLSRMSAFAMQNPEVVESAIVAMKQSSCLTQQLMPEALGVSYDNEDNNIPMEVDQANTLNAVEEHKRDVFFKFACFKTISSKNEVIGELMEQRINLKLNYILKTPSIITSAQDLHHYLLVEGNLASWASLVSWALNDTNSEEMLRDDILYKLISTGIIGGIVCLNVLDTSSPYSSLMYKFMEAMAHARLKERYQVHAVLTYAIKDLVNKNDGGRRGRKLPDILITIWKAVFVAECLPIMLDPLHSLYSPINQYIVYNLSLADKKEAEAKHSSTDLCLAFFEEAIGMALLPAISNSRVYLTMPTTASIEFICCVVKRCLILFETFGEAYELIELLKENVYWHLEALQPPFLSSSFEMTGKKEDRTTSKLNPKGPAWLKALKSTLELLQTKSQ